MEDGAPDAPDVEAPGAKNASEAGAVPSANDQLALLKKNNQYIYKWEAKDPHGDLVYPLNKVVTHDYTPKLDEESVVRGTLAEISSHLSKLETLTKEKELSAEQAAEARQAIGQLYLDLSYSTQVKCWAAFERQIGPCHAGHLAEYTTPRLIRLWYWGKPVLIFACCFILQSFLLHANTVYYIRYMDRYEKMVDPGNRTDTLSLKIEDGQLFDRLGHWFGERKAIPLGLLDATAIIPTCFFVGTYALSFWFGFDSIDNWTKSLLIASVMAVLKGTADLVTTLPDSSGWENCQARLGGELDVLRSMIIEQEEVVDFIVNMPMLLLLEIFGGRYGTVRYCADMLISGHTYFACLFSLSSYKQAKYMTINRRWLRYLIGVVLALCVLGEVLLVSLAKFHYTVDMYISILLVCFLWDSTYIETVASTLTEGYHWRDPKKKGEAPEILPSRSQKLIHLGVLRRFMIEDPDEVLQAKPPDRTSVSPTTE